MMRSLFIPMLFLFLLLSCKKEEDKIYVTPAPPTTTFPVDTGAAKSYLALGDSYTIGQSVPAKERYPNQATALLLGEGIKVSPPEIIAQTGWTTANLIGRINTNPPEKTGYDIVSLLIGVNNQYQHLSQAQYRDEFSLLLNKAIGYAGNKKERVFVLSIPDYSVTPFVSGNSSAYNAVIAKQIDSFNIINYQLAISAGCNYLDITPSSRQALTDPSLIASDGLHPSGKEYRKWALLLSPMIKASLK